MKSMKNFGIALFLLVLIASCAKKDPMQGVISESFNVIEQQAVAMAEYLADKDGLLPKTYDKAKDEIITSDTKWWCSGFFPGVLWYLYEYSGDVNHKKWAETYTDRVEQQKFYTGNHDIGFQINCSFGNGYRLTGKDEYKEVINVAAQSALERYNSELGVIRSWNSNPAKWQYAVIIDNMMNLELLMRNFHFTGNKIFRDVAVSHSDKTLEHHFRQDNSSYHVVS